MRHTNKSSLYIIGSLTITTIISGLILSSASVSADDDSIVDQINITVPVSCTISGTGMNTHNANINNGLYVPDIGTTTLHAFCNDNEGFAIYAAGYTGNEIGGENSNKLVGTNASSNATIVSGIATTAGNPDISNWAMKLAISQDSGDTTSTNAFTIDSAPNVDLPSEAEQSATSTSFSEYHVVPNEYVKVAHKNSMTDMTASTGGVKLTTTYAAYISKTQPADTYSGQVIYTLVHPASATAPSLDGCNPTGTTIGTNSSSDILCMQDFASLSSPAKSTLISNMTEGAQYTLKDKRDEKTYTLAKLADGKVWMTQNLDLDLDSSRTYTNEDTDLGWNESTNSYGVASWTPIRSTYSADANTWCVGGTTHPQYGDCLNDTPESYDPGNIYWNGVTWPQDGVSCETAGGTWRSGGDDYYCDDVSPATFISLNGDSHYQLGNYYNWNAAVAVNDSSSFDVSGELVEQSICPVGWTLPRVGSGDDTFDALWNEYGFNSISYNDENGNWIYDVGEKAIWTSPLYFTIGGSYDSSLHLGRHGQFWSPIMFDNILSKLAGFDSAVYYSVETTGAFSLKSTGFPIRCIAR